MSNFTRITKHPDFGTFEEATWIDMGRIKGYAVLFKDGKIFREKDIKEWRDSWDNK